VVAGAAEGDKCRACLVATAGAADDANTGANLQKCKKNAVVVWAKLCRQITAASVLWLVAAVLHNYRGVVGMQHSAPVCCVGANSDCQAAEQPSCSSTMERSGYSVAK
jgi:hypothetical protein